MLCFGLFQLEDRDCGQCEVAERCADAFAGWRLGLFLKDLGRTMVIEQLAGGVPPEWVFEWDNLPEEELMAMASEQPVLYRKYMQYNAGIRDD